MKTTCLLLLCGLVSIRVLAQSPQPPATRPAVNPPAPKATALTAPTNLLQFPKTFTNAAGTVYHDIKLQQVYTYGIGISYVTTNKMTQGGYLSYNDLSPELQKKLGYDPKATATSSSPKNLDQLRREYLDIADPRKGAADVEQARQANAKADEEARMKAALRRELAK